MNSLEILKRDWAMDNLAAEYLSDQLDNREEKILELAVGVIPEAARQARDINRSRLNEVIATNQGAIAVLGCCSLDKDVNYEPMFDFLEAEQQAHPNSVVSARLNGSKPRTGPGWRGPWASTQTDERNSLFEAYQKAIERGIPIVTEITDSPQLGDLAPYLSGQWIGARDMESTSLRHAFRAIKLMSGVKNGQTPDTETVTNAINTIRSNPELNHSSGFDLGRIAGNEETRGIPTGILPVGSGNENVAIFARGYPLPKEMSAQERRIMAINHLSSMCIKAEELNTAVLIDGTHSVAPMFAIEPKDPNRFLGVLREINRAILNEEIECSNRIRGIIGEVGPVSGRTDPNFILNQDSEKILSEMLVQTFEIINNIK